MVPLFCSHNLKVLTFYVPYIRQNIYRQTAEGISGTGNNLYTEMVQKLYVISRTPDAILTADRRNTALWVDKVLRRTGLWRYNTDPTRGSVIETDDCK